MQVKSLVKGGGAVAIALVLTTAIGVRAASAATLAALQDGKTIVWIDSDKKMVTGSVDLDGGASLIGFDVRPIDGKLYGVTPDGAIVTIDAKTGKWEKKSQLSETLTKNAMHAVDFNPAADRLRIVSDSGVSLRVNVDDGKATVDGQLKYADSDKNMGKAPKVQAVGYTNSVAGTKETTLFDIDVANSMLVRQAPPNDGTLNTVGALGVKLDGPVAFDIWSDGTKNAAWLLAGGALHAVDLTTGMATSAGAVTGLKGKIGDIAILPAM